jgi:hypothetical protein
MSKKSEATHPTFPNLSTTLTEDALHLVTITSAGKLIDSRQHLQSIQHTFLETGILFYSTADHITIDKIHHNIRRLKNTKAPGPDITKPIFLLLLYVL